jgi:hypothetical protein
MIQYEDLTIHQRISLKGYFHTNSKLHAFKIVMKLWDFREAVKTFLNEDYYPNPTNSKQLNHDSKRIKRKIS